MSSSGSPTSSASAETGASKPCSHGSLSPPGITRTWPASHEGHEVGPVTDAVWSPGLQANIGYVWVPTDLAGPGTSIDVESEHGWVSGRTAAIPFVDPRKERPAAALRPASA